MTDNTEPTIDNLNTIVRRIINDTKTGVIDLLDNNGRSGLYHAIEDLERLIDERSQPQPHRHPERSKE